MLGLPKKLKVELELVGGGFFCPKMPVVLLVLVLVLFLLKRWEKGLEEGLVPELAAVMDVEVFWAKMLLVVEAGACPFLTRVRGGLLMPELEPKMFLVKMLF